MRRILPILALVCAVASYAWDRQTTPPSAAPKTASAAPVDENAQKARQLIDQAVAALGGPMYLNIRDRESQGRTYSLHHGESTGGGALFWSFWEFPDKERVELTKERDIAELFVGDKGFEITYKGPHPMEAKDVTDYLRRRHYSLENVLRTWINDPGVILLYEGTAIAQDHSAQKITLVNPKNESVTVYLDSDTHLPLKKSFEWRDPVDRQKNLEDEVYDNYRPVAGIMAPFNITRYFNGDMAAQRFLFSVTINQGLDPAMFNPNSGYNPNKQPSTKH